MTQTYDYLKQGFKVKRSELKTQIHILLAKNTWVINSSNWNLSHLQNEENTDSDFVRIQWIINLHIAYGIINAQKVLAQKGWSSQLIMVWQLVTPILTTTSHHKQKLIPDEL